jgi:GNAT superfamily N-acetyltransferase
MGQTSETISIRAATIEDVPLIFSFIQKKIDFDRAIGAYSGVPTVTLDKLHRTLFGVIPFSYVVFAVTSNREIGFALYTFRYSSFAAQPSIWLDDLFVDADARSQGAGAILMEYLADIATTHHCTHLAWTADARNTRGISFYHRLGATIIQQTGDRCFLNWTP